MRDDLLYLPVSAAERDLIRWLRGSRFKDGVGDFLGLARSLSELPVNLATLRARVPELGERIANDETLREFSRELASLQREVALLQQAQQATGIALEELGSRPTELGPPARPQPAPAADEPARAAPEPEPTPPSGKGHGLKKPLPTFIIDGVRLTGKTIPQLIEAVLHNLIESGQLLPSGAPFVVGRHRVFVATEAIHPSGKPFVRPLSQGGLVAEAHQSASSAVGLLRKLLDELDIAFEVEKGPAGEAAAPSADRHRFRVGDRIVDATNIPALFTGVLRALVDQRLLDDGALPAGKGKKRFLLAKQNTHPSGRPFFREIEYQGYFMEAHFAVLNGLRSLRWLLDELGVDYEALTT